MKTIFVVESSGGRKWRPEGFTVARAHYVTAFYSKKEAKEHMRQEAKNAPGLKWRVARYERVAEVARAKERGKG